jgi:AraC family transcriptional regulator of adaptative response/methylated-DNA-[protein]-cysteine methyltransferase
MDRTEKDDMTTRAGLLAAATSRDPRWATVLARDPEGDGRFFYSVRTTGVYCRPSCAARTPRPENVTFHITGEEAERSGFRPCKRCKPDQLPLCERRAASVAALCRFIEDAERPPSLAEMARHAGMSAYHLHRVFQQVTGLTPRAYAAAERARRVRGELDRRDTVTEAIHGAGYGSSGRFYEESGRVLGMTPTRYRAGGAGLEIRFAIGECSLGSILVARSDRGVCAISLGDDPDELARELQDRFPAADLIGGDAAFAELVARVVDLVEAPGLGLDLPLDVRGTAFQQRVWRALREIPAGETASYAEIARRIGSPGSVRAVARACAANALAVAIPCHRVVRKDGGLSGYRWGVERKRALLEREAGAARSPGTRRPSRRGAARRAPAVGPVTLTGEPEAPSGGRPPKAGGGEAMRVRGTRRGAKRDTTLQCPVTSPGALRMQKCRKGEEEPRAAPRRRLQGSTRSRNSRPLLLPKPQFPGSNRTDGRRRTVMPPIASFSSRPSSTA